MLHKLSFRIVAALMVRSDCQDKDAEIYAYGLECFLAGVLQLLALAVTGITCGCAGETALFSLFFTSLKRNIGGYHAGSHWSCIGGYTVAAVGAARLAKSLPLGCLSSGLAFCGVCTASFLVWRYAPAVHPHHPKTAGEIARSRSVCLRVAATHAVLIVLAIPLFPGLSCFWLSAAGGSFAAAVTLVIPNVRGKEGEAYGAQSSDP